MVHMDSTLESVPTWSWKLSGKLLEWNFDPSGDVFFGITHEPQEEYVLFVCSLYPQNDQLWFLEAPIIFTRYIYSN